MAASSAASAAPSCQGEDRTVTRPFPTRGVQTEQWEMPAPPDDSTFDLGGVTSTAYPATRSVFEVGVEEPALRTCVIGGTVQDAAEDDETWDYYHDESNAGCVKVSARDWTQVRDLRCDNVRRHRQSRSRARTRTTPRSTSRGRICRSTSSTTCSSAVRDTRGGGRRHRPRAQLDLHVVGLGQPGG